MKLNVTTATTLRQATRMNIDTSTAPEGATHVSVWERGGRKAVVWEKRAWGGMKTWDDGAWTSTEAHYVAGRALPVED